MIGEQQIKKKNQNLCYSGLIIPMNHEELVQCWEPWGKYPYILPGPGREGLGSSRQTSKSGHKKICDFMEYCKRLLKAPWTSRKSNQSILKEINPEYSLEGWMLKQKLQYFRHLMWRADSFPSLTLGKIEGRRRGERQRWDGWMASPTQRTWVWARIWR